MSEVMTALAIVAMLTVARAAGAQDAGTSRAEGACSYRDCGVGIAPAWNGLLVVRGSEQRRMANLNFFLPRDISPVLRGDPAALGADSALTHAERSVALRRAGAVLTDVGAVAVVVAIVHAASAGKANANDRVVGGAGLAALLVSVPIQFAADGALSRAVWWHNLRYAR